jgi:hypothetical protein
MFTTRNQKPLKGIVIRHAGVVSVIALFFGLAGLSLTAGIARAVDIRVTGDGGAQVDRGNGWEAAETGDVLSTCHKIRLPGNYSWLTWERIGGCGNKGRVETGLSKIKEYHVGTDLPAGRGAMTNLLQAGFFDLLVGPGVSGSDATIYEASECYGNGHCGLNVGFAAVAAIDPTPEGAETVFSGCLQLLDDDIQVAVFYNHRESPIPVYIETMANQQLNILAPGWWAQVTTDGQVTMLQGDPPLCGPDDQTPTEDASWGRIKMLYR